LGSKLEDKRRKNKNVGLSYAEPGPKGELSLMKNFYSPEIWSPEDIGFKYLL
jgi:hypothetical protein